jgi:hypothetical protein
MLPPMLLRRRDAILHLEEDVVSVAKWALNPGSTDSLLAS